MLYNYVTIQGVSIGQLNTGRRFPNNSSDETILSDFNKRKIARFERCFNQPISYITHSVKPTSDRIELQTGQEYTSLNKS